MKNIVIILVFCSQISFSQDIVENDSLLLWQANRPLKWEDFKGEQLNHHGNVLAETFGEIKTVDCVWIGNKIPLFKIAVFMDKNNSWTITDDLESLEHEQIHFDIFELSARKMREKFAELNKKEVTDVNVYEDTFAEYLQMNKNLHEEYDVDVITDQKKQEEWRTKIAEGLEELKEYQYVPKE